MTSGRVTTPGVVVVSIEALEGGSLVYRDRAGSILVLQRGIFDRCAEGGEAIWLPRSEGRLGLWGGQIVDETGGRELWALVGRHVEGYRGYTETATDKERSRFVVARKSEIRMGARAEPCSVNSLMRRGRRGHVRMACS